MRQTATNARVPRANACHFALCFHSIYVLCRTKRPLVMFGLPLVCPIAGSGGRLAVAKPASAAIAWGSDIEGPAETAITPPTASLTSFWISLLRSRSGAQVAASAGGRSSRGASCCPWFALACKATRRLSSLRRFPRCSHICAWRSSNSGQLSRLRPLKSLRCLRKALMS